MVENAEILRKINAYYKNSRDFQSPGIPNFLLVFCRIFLKYIHRLDANENIPLYFYKKQWQRENRVLKIKMNENVFAFYY